MSLHGLHEGLETIAFLGKYNGHTLNLPWGLKSITLYRDGTTAFTLPPGCVRLYCEPLGDSTSKILEDIISGEA